MDTLAAYTAIYGSGLYGLYVIYSTIRNHIREAKMIEFEEAKEAFRILRARGKVPTQWPETAKLAEFFGLKPSHNDSYSGGLTYPSKRSEPEEL